VNLGDLLKLILAVLFPEGFPSVLYRTQASFTTDVGDDIKNGWDTRRHNNHTKKVEGRELLLNLNN